jgi:DinB superfamily
VTVGNFTREAGEIMRELSEAIASVFAERYSQNAARVRESANPLSDAQFWQKPFSFGNSFGHLVLHLTGNLNYYIGAQIGNTGYVRDRPREFANASPPPKAEALTLFDDAVAMVLSTIAMQSREDWTKEYSGSGTEAKTRLELFLICAGTCNSILAR